MRSFILIAAFLYCVNAFGVWSEFAHITPESESKYDFKVTIEEKGELSKHIVLKIPFKSSLQVARLIKTTKPLSRLEQKSLREQIWDGKNLTNDIVFSTLLSINGQSDVEKTINELINGESNKVYHYEIKTSLCMKNVYVYIDFPIRVDDGGYWYSVDIERYLNGKNC